MNVSRTAVGTYRVTHNLGHNSYVPIIGQNQPGMAAGTAEFGNKGISYEFQIANRTSTYFDVLVRYRYIRQFGDDNINVDLYVGANDIAEYIYVTVVETI